MWSRVYDLVIAAGFVVRIQYQIQKLDSRALAYYTSQQLNNKKKSLQKYLSISVTKLILLCSLCQFYDPVFITKFAHICNIRRCKELQGWNTCYSEMKLRGLQLHKSGHVYRVTSVRKIESQQRDILTLRDSLRDCHKWGLSYTYRVTNRAEFMQLKSGERKPEKDDN